MDRLALVQANLGHPYGDPWPILAVGSVEEMRAEALRLLSGAQGPDGVTPWELLLLHTRRRVQVGRKTSAGRVVTKWSRCDNAILELGM